MIHIFTDSTSDLSLDIISEFGIKVVPLSVTIGGEVFQDGVNIHQKDLFALVNKYGELPKTAAPSVGEFIKEFDIPGEIIFIGISSKLSGTISNALLAAQTYQDEKVRVIDSLNLSTGIGLLVLRAAGLRDQGLTALQIEERIQQSVSNVRSSFVIDTMEYLYKGGRCTALQAIAGSVLKIHPIIEVKQDGTLGVKEKARGTLQKGYQRMLDDFRASIDDVDRERIFVTHTCQNEEDMRFLLDGVKQLAAMEDIRVTMAGSVIASHCGPNTAGILYFLK